LLIFTSLWLLLLQVAEICRYLADVYRKLAAYDDAMALYNRALEINRNQLGPDHPEVAETLNAVGLIYKIRGNFTEAVEVIQKAIHIIEKVQVKFSFFLMCVAANMFVVFFPFFSN